MKLLGNCGCDERKAVMFEHGNLGVTEAVIVVAVIIAVTSAVIYGRKVAE